MVAPAIAVVASFIARNGIQKAIKKYGRAAVDKARKQAKDMTTKPTAGQKQIKKATQGQRTYRSGQRKAGATGVGLGIAGSAAMRKEQGDKAKGTNKASDGRVKPSDYPTYKGSSDSAAAFRKAFREAKAKGQKTFTFEGRRYSTKTK